METTRLFAQMFHFLSLSSQAIKKTEYSEERQESIH